MWLIGNPVFVSYFLVFGTINILFCAKKITIAYGIFGGILSFWGLVLWGVFLYFYLNYVLNKEFD